MANERHLAVVRLGVEAIRQWRAQHSNEPMDLSGGNLLGADLRGAEFLGADFRKAMLQSSDFTAGSARGATFDEATLQRACFERADLSWASLVAVDLQSADISRARLEKANLERAEMTDANLGGANLRGANLVGAVLERANLEFADLTGANLLGANLKNAKLRGTILAEASVIGARFHEAALQEAALHGNPMTGAIMEKPDAPPRAAFAGPTAAEAGAGAPSGAPILDPRRARLRVELKQDISYKSLVELLRALAQLNALVDPAVVVLERMVIGFSDNVMNLINDGEKARAGDAPQSQNWVAVEMCGRAAACAKECMDAVSAQQKMASSERDADANVISIRTIRLRKHKYENTKWRMNHYAELGVSEEDLVRKVEPMVERSVDPLAVLQELAKDQAILSPRLIYIGPPTAGAAPAAGAPAKVETQTELRKLIAALNAGDWHARWSAAVALGQMGPDASLAVPELIECLKDEKRAVRYTAVCALSSIGAPGAIAAVPALVGALRDSDIAVRAEAAKALKRLAPQ